ncbi:hypothetical protein B0H67DRAFT_581121 [Lasiosphaeris hirsuta]|uniref:Uncharacterized protein n=1 Tax=Lasiosphaeris hirsuta TaxID=260670 RepID=A0AA40AGV3_9PEZI|nr:hypothetical protein B0H67DRAFT_581121 [Lasiosphaeris hirsuta]
MMDPHQASLEELDASSPQQESREDIDQRVVRWLDRIRNTGDTDPGSTSCPHNCICDDGARIHCVTNAARNLVVDWLCSLDDMDNGQVLESRRVALLAQDYREMRAQFSGDQLHAMLLDEDRETYLVRLAKRVEIDLIKLGHRSLRFSEWIGIRPRERETLHGILIRFSDQHFGRGDRVVSWWKRAIGSLTRFDAYSMAPRKPYP